MDDHYTNIFDHDYVNQTVLHPIGLLAVVVLGLSLLIVPRRYAVWPMIVMACFIAPAQRIVVFTLNFDLLRVMVLFGTVRVLARGEWRGMRWGKIDLFLLLWVLSGAVIYIISYASFDAVKYRLGTMYDAVGMYFLFRMLIRGWNDARTAIAGFVLIGIPVALAFMLEHATGRNIFAVFGGVPEITAVREGRVRCQGAFAHEILAGCFWAGMMPLIGAEWWRGGRRRVWSVVGIAACCVVVVTCASSTPVMAVVVGLVSAAFFPMRRHLRAVRWAIVLGLLILHIVMKAPVWNLIARIDLAGGSTGWQRYHLIDEAIHRFPDWCVLGTHSTAQWGEGLYDVTNQYILEGVRGGALTMCLFLVMIGCCFQAVGRLCRRSKNDRPQLVLAWALGVALVVHCMNFMAVSYFGQIQLVWYLLLAMIGSLVVLPCDGSARPRNAGERGAKAGRELRNIDGRDSGRGRQTAGDGSRVAVAKGNS